MRHYLLRGALIALLALSPISSYATSKTVLTGNAAGIELCPEFICGVAIFAGSFVGQVNGRPTAGVFSAAINHDPLPPVGGLAPITGGKWRIRTLRTTFEGDVSGGTLLNLNDVQFAVAITMELTGGGTGDVTFTGILDHGTLIPTIAGRITQ